MRESLLDYLVCPACREELELLDGRSVGEHVMSGRLRCTACGGEHPIRDGVPVMVPASLAAPVEETAKSFGWQWNRFDELLPLAEQQEQFLDWVAPLQPADFEGQVVLDAGCGMGRLSEAAASFGAKAVIAADLSSAVQAAFRRLRDRPNAHVVQADIYNLPLRRGEGAQVDLGYSVGVLHHLPDPRGGFESALSHVRAGGRFHGWVYGKEGNGWVVHLVTPVRERFTSKLPPPALLGLSYGLTVPLQVAARAARRLPLPYGDYLRWLGQYPFRHNLQIVFDHLNPPIAFYISREELEEWVAGSPVELESLTPRNANSWRLLVRKSAGQ